MSKSYCAKCDSSKNKLLRFGNTHDYASAILKSKDVMKYRDTDVSVYRTIVDENRNHPEDIAIIFRGHRITYRELLAQADLVSDILTSMNIRKGDIILLGANSPQTVSILLACSRIGAGVMILTTRTAPDGSYIYPYMIETVLLKMPEVSRMKMVNIMQDGSPAYAIHVIPKDLSEDAQRLAEKIYDSLSKCRSLTYLPSFIKIRDSFPKNQGGKVDMQQLAGEKDGFIELAYVKRECR